MRKQIFGVIVVLFLFFGLTVTTLGDDQSQIFRPSRIGEPSIRTQPVDGDDDGGCVFVCHIPPGNPSNAHTICVGESAVDAHLAHGDTLGPCGGPDDLLELVHESELHHQNAAAIALFSSAQQQDMSVELGQIASVLVPRGRTIATAPESEGSWLLFLSRLVEGAQTRLAPGLYQIEVDPSGAAALFYFHPDMGKVLVGLPIPPPDPEPFHTPLGDDMCGDAPDLIMDFCQSFVACAAYDLFC